MNVIKLNGLSYCSNDYYINIYDLKNNLLYSGKSDYLGNFYFKYIKKDFYKIEINYSNTKINRTIYVKDNNQTFYLNEQVNNIKKISLYDYYYDMPINKGELILWHNIM